MVSRKTRIVCVIMDSRISLFPIAVSPCRALGFVGIFSREYHEGIDRTNGESSLRKETCSKKRFVELGKFLELGRLPKTDKLAILDDAVRMVTQLQGESQKLKELDLNLQEKIKELKNEKNELRNEKQRLKLEKEKLEQQMKTLCTPQPSFLQACSSIHPCYICSSKPSFDQQSDPHHQLPRCRYLALHATYCCRYFTGPFASPSCCLSWQQSHAILWHGSWRNG